MLKLSQAFSKWAAPPGGSQKKHPYDHIETYLSDPVMTVESIKTYGGYLAYWEVARKERPAVSQMALDYVSAPGIVSTTSNCGI